MTGGASNDTSKQLLGTLELTQRLGIWEWLPATNEMLWSDGLYQLLDIAPTVKPSMAGLIALVHPADRARFETHLARARRERGLLAFRCRTVGGAAGTPDPAPSRTLQVRMQPTLAADGSLRSVVATSQDVTDDATTLAAFTGALAHQINNPLAVVSAYLQLLPADAEPTDALVAVDRIRAVIADLRLCALGDPSSTKTAVQLEHLIELAFAQLPELHARATIVTHFERTPAVYANAASLARVVVELLRNALDAVATGERAEIQVTTRVDGEWSLLAIADSGVGIEPALQARIFDPFFTTKGVGARGLGLSIARGIVDSLGGSISVHSGVGGGTRVILALPVSKRPDVEPAVVRNEPRRDVPERGRILIVDDEALFASSLRRLLAIEYDVDIAENGRLALDRIEAGERYDAIVCDLMMPVMTGSELYTALADSVADQAARMIFLTGGTLDGAPHELGHVPTFEKPCDVTALREALRRRVAEARKP